MGIISNFGKTVKKIVSWPVLGIMAGASLVGAYVSMNASDRAVMKARVIDARADSLKADFYGFDKAIESLGIQGKIDDYFAFQRPEIPRPIAQKGDTLSGIVEKQLKNYSEKPTSKMIYTALNEEVAPRMDRHPLTAEDARQLAEEPYRNWDKKGLNRVDIGTKVPMDGTITKPLDDYNAKRAMMRNEINGRFLTRDSYESQKKSTANSMKYLQAKAKEEKQKAKGLEGLTCLLAFGGFAAAAAALGLRDESKNKGNPPFIEPKGKTEAKAYAARLAEAYKADPATVTPIKDYGKLEKKTIVLTLYSGKEFSNPGNLEKYMTKKDISEATGLSKYAIDKIVKESGVKTRKETISEHTAKIDKLLTDKAVYNRNIGLVEELYDEGNTVGDIAKQLKTTNKIITGYLQNAGALPYTKRK